eukprot:scaffold2671_cov167-Amphora_coffeaeformis.AAC.7
MTMVRASAQKSSCKSVDHPSLTVDTPCKLGRPHTGSSLKGSAPDRAVTRTTFTVYSSVRYVPSSSFLNGPNERHTSKQHLTTRPNEPRNETRE